MSRGKTIKIAVSATLVAGAVAYLMISSFDDSMVYYKTVDELLGQAARFEGRPVRVNGVLVPGSVRQKPGTDQFRFQISKSGALLDVAYAGILPDAMTEDQELVLHGILQAETRVFVASEILTKCPSKYEARAKAKGP